MDDDENTMYWFMVLYTIGSNLIDNAIKEGKEVDDTVLSRVFCGYIVLHVIYSRSLSTNDDLKIDYDEINNE